MFTWGWCYISPWDKSFQYGCTWHCLHVAARPLTSGVMQIVLQCVMSWRSTWPMGVTLHWWVVVCLMTFNLGSNGSCRALTVYIPTCLQCWIAAENSAFANNSKTCTDDQTSIGSIYFWDLQKIPLRCVWIETQGFSQLSCFLLGWSSKWPLWVHHGTPSIISQKKTWPYLEGLVTNQRWCYSMWVMKLSLSIPRMVYRPTVRGGCVKPRETCVKHPWNP